MHIRFIHTHPSCEISPYSQAGEASLLEKALQIMQLRVGEPGAAGPGVSQTVTSQVNSDGLRNSCLSLRLWLIIAALATLLDVVILGARSTITSMSFFHFFFLFSLLSSSCGFLNEIDMSGLFLIRLASSNLDLSEFALIKPIMSKPAQYKPCLVSSFLSSLGDHCIPTMLLFLVILSSRTWRLFESLAAVLRSLHSENVWIRPCSRRGFQSSVSVLRLISGLSLGDPRCHVFVLKIISVGSLLVIETSRTVGSSSV